MEQEVRQRLPFSFTGNGGEYFRIWIVNLCLSLLTLGIYSAWAKVRRSQYFYRHTSVAGANFDYHGDPKAILKGRILAAGMFAIYSLAGKFSVFAGLAAFVLIMSIMPWLLVRSLRFRMYNTSYRGLRFSFHGGLGDAYVNFLLLPIVAYVSVGLLMPLAHQQITRFVRNQVRFGDEHFQFHAGSGVYYKPYIKLFFIGMAALVVGVVLAVMLASSGLLGPMAHKAKFGLVVAGLGYLAFLLFTVPYLSARLQNIVWNNTTVGVHSFSSNARVRDLFGIMLSNLVLIVLTLGLYKPFADIRLARYRIEHIQFLPAADLEDVAAGEYGGQVSATGEEMADVFDMDIAI